MKLDYQWIKRADDALDPGFIGPLARQFGLDVFIETGTYRGDTLASMRALFTRLISVELSPELAAAAAARFAADPAISIIQDDSARGLGKAFAQLGERPALLWLDAHYSGGPTARAGGNTPILAEIERLLADRDGRDVILIDDARLFWPVPEGFLDHDTLSGYPLLSEIAERLVASRHGYQVLFLGDALLAMPPGIEPSPVLAACTRSRLALPGSQPSLEIERTLRAAEGIEAERLADPPAWLETQRAYGLGGHHFYWRGLLRERDGLDHEATADLAFAARCGVLSCPRESRADA